MTPPSRPVNRPCRSSRLRVAPVTAPRLRFEVRNEPAKAPSGASGQRLHRYGDYLAALAAAQLPTEPFETYLEAFRFGMPPHGGFAIGLERLLMQLLDLPNLRLTSLFPRDLNRLTP